MSTTEVGTSEPVRTNGAGQGSNTGQGSNKAGSGPVEVPKAALSSFDIGELSGQLHRVTGALDQLQSDNRVLSEALTDAQRALKSARQTERAAEESVDSAKRDLLRMQATVDRRDGEITDLKGEVEGLRADRREWEAGILAERDRVVERQVADLAAAREDLKAMRAKVADLQNELAVERQRTAPDSHVVQMMTTSGTVLLIDGEDLVTTSWPGSAPERRRGQVIEAAGRFHRRHGVSVELLLASGDGWDATADLPAGLRVRVPHEGIPISVCLAQLVRVHSDSSPVVTVSGTAAEEPWISPARASALMGLPVPPEPTAQAAGSKIPTNKTPTNTTTTRNLKPATEVEK